MKNVLDVLIITISVFMLLAMLSCTTALPTLPPSSYAVVQKKLEFNGSFSNCIADKIGDKKFLFASANEVVGGTYHPPGILICDITDPLNPIEVSSLHAPDGVKSISDIEISGNLLYASTWGSLWIVDISNPASPKSLSEIRDLQPLSTSISDKFLYADDNGRLVGAKIAIADISNPVDPQVVSILDLAPSYNFSHFKIFGSLLFTFSQDENNSNINHLHIFDISSPGSLKEVGTISLDASAPFSSVNQVPFDGPIPSTWSPPAPLRVSSNDYDIVTMGKYAYIAMPGEGLWVMDMSNPASPQKMAVFSKTELPERVGVTRLLFWGNRLYLVSNEVTIIDISDPINLKEVASIPVLSSPFTISGNYIYYFFRDPAAIAVQDVSLPAK